MKYLGLGIAGFWSNRCRSLAVHDQPGVKRSPENRVYAEKLRAYAQEEGFPLLDTGSVPGSDLGDFGFFISPNSVFKGDQVQVYAHSTEPRTVKFEIFRSNSSRQGYAKVHEADVSVVNQGLPRIDHHDNEPFVTCNHWKSAHSFFVADDWINGLYFGRMSYGPIQKIFPFVMEEIQTPANIGVLIPLMTSPGAYNHAISSSPLGRNFYDGYDPEKKVFDNRLRAKILSYHRPLSHHTGRQFCRRVQPITRFLESNGFSVNYFSEMMIERNPSHLDQFDVVVLVEHPEYVTETLQKTLSQRIKAGAHLFSLSANAFYWQTQLQTLPSGETLISIDKTGNKSLWRHQIRQGKRQDEQQFFGVMYGDYNHKQNFPLVINPKKDFAETAKRHEQLDHWIFENTHLEIGEEIPDLIEGEADWFFPEYSLIDTKDVVAFHSEYGGARNEGKKAATVFFQRKNGQMTFHSSSFNMQKVFVSDLEKHQKVAKMLLNILRRMDGNSQPMKVP